MKQLNFNDKKGFICDMDGVIYHGNKILPGVAEFIQWLHDEKMETYLRPETLFGTKFEGYLNQKGGKNDRRGEKGLESGMASEVPWSVFRGDFD